MRTVDGKPVVDVAEDNGATAVEYALMATFIAVAIAVTVGMLGTTLLGIFSTMAAGL